VKAQGYAFEAVSCLKEL